MNSHPPLLFAPAHHTIGDPTIIRVGDQYHLFAEQTPNEPGLRVIGHAVSRDMMTWTELPAAITQAAPNAGQFDSYTVYHLDVFVWNKRWYMHYTGLDKAGPGQKQQVGLATSDDGLTWTKHPANPILAPDPRWYEQYIPDDATYQEKDRGRMWFRDPMIMRDEASQKFVLVIMGRDKTAHPYLRGCLAAATSDDLVHWSSHPPIFSPTRFHTIETPSIFAHGNRHYIIYMSHPAWGGPIMTTDPYQEAGDFYAVSDTGWAGPYRTLSDEIVVAARGRMRLGAQRTVAAPDGTRYVYGWLNPTPTADDVQDQKIRKSVPYPKPVRFLDDGRMEVMFNPQVHQWAKATSTGTLQPLDHSHWRTTNTTTNGKDLRTRSIAITPEPMTDFVWRARVRFHQGERAGIIMRADASGNTGWYALADRRFGRIEFGALDNPTFIDARLWQPRDQVELTVVAYGPVVEIYADRRLIIMQVRYRETSGRLGLIVERGEATFTEFMRGEL